MQLRRIVALAGPLHEKECFLGPGEHLFEPPGAPQGGRHKCKTTIGLHFMAIRFGDLGLITMMSGCSRCTLLKPVSGNVEAILRYVRTNSQKVRKIRNFPTTIRTCWNMLVLLVCTKFACFRCPTDTRTDTGFFIFSSGQDAKALLDQLA